MPRLTFKIGFSCQKHLEKSNDKISLGKRFFVIDIFDEFILCFLKWKQFFTTHLKWQPKKCKTLELILSENPLPVDPKGQGSIEGINVAQLMLDSLTTILVEPYWCPSHQYILLTQGPIPETFAKKYWELVGLKNSVFFE